MKKFFRTLCAYLTALSMLTFAVGGAAAYLTPNELSVSPDSDISFCTFPVSVRYNDTAVAADAAADTTATAELMLFGSVPVKQINVNFTDRPTVTIGGEPFGIRLYTDGLVVSQTSDVPTSAGNKNPANEAGISCGDIIISVGGKKLRTNEQLMSAVEQSSGKPIVITAMHDGEKYTAHITPVMDVQLKSYRLGLWVRDSCAGIGTVTFTDKSTNTFAGLGHGIADSESGSIMPLAQGDIVTASIASVEKSVGGYPGSLCGYFSDNNAVGTISANDECGIYGSLNGSFGSGTDIPVAFRQEVVRGKAQIRTTISGSTPEYYDIEIEDISYNNVNITKNMVINITDERLLDKTGGIVQGMSGSPIIQNGRLVGAVTHVFINDPSHGYAVFAENMTDFNNCIVQKNTNISP